MYLNNDDHHQIYHGYILSWTLKPVKKTKSKSNDYRSYLTLIFSSSVAVLILLIWRGKSLTWFNVPKQWSIITKFLSHITHHNHGKLSNNLTQSPIIMDVIWHKAFLLQGSGAAGGWLSTVLIGFISPNVKKLNMV